MIAATSGLLLVLAVLARVQVSGQPLTQILDAPLQDRLVRLRNLLQPPPVSTDITLVGIDDYTVRQLGRYGQGPWKTRRPFRDQLQNYRTYFPPAVLAYDILFKEDVGETVAATSGDETTLVSPPRLTALAKELGELAAETQVEVSPDGLETMNDLAVRQGNLAFAKELSLLKEPGQATGKATVAILGYHFPDATGAHKPWTQEELLGREEDGLAENHGSAVPDLYATRIPRECVHNIPPRYPYITYAANLPTRDLRDYCAVAFLNVPREVDGVVRRYPLVYGVRYEFKDPKTQQTVKREYFVPSLALLACLQFWGVSPHLPEPPAAAPGQAPAAAAALPPVEIFLGRHVLVRRPGLPELRIPIDAQGQLLLDWVGNTQQYRSLPFCLIASSTLAGKWLHVQPATPGPAPGAATGATQPTQVSVDKELYERLAHKIVFIGQTETGGSDVGPTPVDSHAPLVLVHMTAASNMLTGTFLRTIPYLELWVLVALWLCVTPAALLLRPVRFTLWQGLLLLGYAVLVYWCLRGNRAQLPLLLPAAFLGLSYVAVLLHYYIAELREKHKIRGMFSTMVSGEVLQYLEDNPGSFSLAGQQREATMMFSDVAGFTTISESLSATDLVELLNQYLTPMTEIILSHHGYVDKYEGDAIMAEWGVPFPSPDHAIQACYAVLDQQAALAALRPKLYAAFGHYLHVRMGLNSGTVSAGNMGSAKRFSYTVMGDAVNQAARFEPANKDYGTNIMLGESTYLLAKAKIEVRHLDKLVVKGKSQPINIYELLARKGELSDNMAKVVSLYHHALDLHWTRHWQPAVDALQEALRIRPSDGPCITLIQRIQEYQHVPPPDNWQGEYVRVRKD